MDNEVKELKTKRKVEKKEIINRNLKKTGLIAGCVAGGVVATAVGLGLGLGLKTNPKFEVKLNSEYTNLLDGAGDYKKGTQVTILAEEIEGYNFSHWEFKDEKIYENPYVFEMSKDTQGTYVAVYEEKAPVLTLNVNGTTFNTIEIEKGSILSQSIPQIDETYTNEEYTCGFYLDEKLTQPLDATTTITSNMTLYTKIATLDKLAFTKSDDETYYEVEAINDEIEGEVVLPVKYNGIDVTSIKGPVADDYGNVSSGGFANAVDMTSIVMHNGILSIGEMVFKNCTSIENIYFFDSLQSIGSDCFYNCNNLKELNIPSNVNLESQSFIGCKKLEKISIPANATSILALDYCYNLKEIKVDENNETYTVVDNVLFNKDVTELIHYPSQREGKEYTIPDTVTSLENFSFAREKVNLEVLNIPASLTDISYQVFCDYYYHYEGIYDYDNTTLKTINVDEKNTVFSSVDGILYNKNKSVLYFCPNGRDTAVVLDGTITFNSPQNNWGGLSYCIKIPSLTLSGNLTLGSSCFQDLHGLEELNFGINLSGVTSNSGYFAEAGKDSGGVTINIKNNVTSIPDCLFNSATEYIYVKDIIFEEDSKCTSIGRQGFAGCIVSGAIHLPSSITSIGDFAFTQEIAAVILDSSSIYTSLTSNSACGNLLQYTKTINVLASIINDGNYTNSYLNNSSNYTKSTTTTTINGKEYYTYTKVSN